jgi:AAA+ superfamily predicted ATPase
MAADDLIAPLREALALSPDNVPLRRHLADLLLAHGQPVDAEAEYRRALTLAAADLGLQLGLVRAFLQQQKSSAALALVEELVKRPAAPPEAFVIHARLLAARGEIPAAIAQYRLGVEQEATVADAGFEAQLGIGGAYADGEVSEGRVRDRDDAGPAAADVERPRISFADVGGMDELKEEIRLKIIHPLAHPELYRAYGKRIGGGILMYGPPGCGKTHIARATAGEIAAGFISVGISDVLDMWIGSSERNLHAIFEQARRHAPCVLFFDEVDALGARRSDMVRNAGRQIINQFLAELDGANASNDGVLVLAATNCPWHVDPAFRRPGRFDRVLFVPPPDAPAREQILRILCRDKPAAGADMAAVARKTADFSGADLQAVVDQAVEAKLREAMKAGGVRPLVTADLVAAAARHKPTIREWFATAKNHALYANEGGMYDDILKHLGIGRR